MSAVTRTLRLHLLPVIDRVAEKRAAHHRASCTKGCAACCYQIVYVTDPEALLIAESLLRDRAQLTGVLPRLREQALYSERFRDQESDLSNLWADRVGYFDGRQPCAFLDANLCAIYPERPIACRVYYVVSPPAECNGPSGTTVTVVDTSDLQLKQAEFAAAASAPRDPNLAPLANAVLWALHAACKYPHPMYAAVRAACAGTLSPREWSSALHEEARQRRAAP